MACLLAAPAVLPQVLATYNDENIYEFMSEQEQLVSRGARERRRGLASRQAAHWSQTVGEQRGSCPIHRRGAQLPLSPPLLPGSLPLPGLQVQQQAAAAEAGGVGGTRVAQCAAGPDLRAQALRQRGSSTGAGRGKRARSSSAGGGSEDGGAAARHALATRARRDQQHAAASAALAAAQDQRAASGAAAAAEAHASMRRRLLDAEADERGAGPSQPLAGAASGQQADAAWLSSVPPPRNSSQQHSQQAAEQGGQPGSMAGGGQAAAAAPADAQQHSGNGTMHTGNGGGANGRSTSSSGTSSEEGSGAGLAGARGAAVSECAEALEGVDDEAGSGSGEGWEGPPEAREDGYDMDTGEEEEEGEEEEGFGSDEEDGLLPQVCRRPMDLGAGLGGPCMHARACAAWCARDGAAHVLLASLTDRP